MPGDVDETGRRRLGLAVGAALLAALTGAVLRGTGGAPAARIVHPADGAVVGSPVAVVLAAEGVELVPCGPARACEGHLNVIVDRPCLAGGELIPSGSLRADELGVHALTDGASTTLIDLPLGEHTLCAQLADGARLAFGATDTVTVTVDHVMTHGHRDVVATVRHDTGRPGVESARSDPWPAPTSVTASRTSP